MQPTRLLPLLSALILFMTSCQQKKEVFKIPAGHVGMFGYGSLTSRNFIETGLLNSTYEGPFLSAHLRGYKRSWTFAWPADIPFQGPDGRYYKEYIVAKGDTIYPQYLHYLNIREDGNSIVNGVLYIVRETDLPTYDSWELGYERFDVSGDIVDYRIEGGPVFAYRALPDFEKEPTGDYTINIIEQSYSDIIQEAFDYWGDTFEFEYKDSTEPFDSTIIRANQKELWMDPPLERTQALKATFEYPGR